MASREKKSRFPRIIGHRGCGVLGYENTMASFKKALEMKLDGLEFDVQLTKDGQAVVYHDNTVILSKGGIKKISRVTFERLRHEKLINGERIPKLDHALGFLGNRIRLNIELKKGWKDFGPLIYLLKKHEIKKESIRISSFNIGNLKKIKKIDPDIPCGWLSKRLFRNSIKKAADNGIEALHLHTSSLTSGRVKRAKSKGLILAVWTVNEIYDMQKMVKYGVDEIITDYPDRLMKLKSFYTKNAG